MYHSRHTALPPHCGSQGDRGDQSHPPACTWSVRKKENWGLLSFFLLFFLSLGPELHPFQHCCSPGSVEIKEERRGTNSCTALSESKFSTYRSMLIWDEIYLLSVCTCSTGRFQGSVALQSAMIILIFDFKACEDCVWYSLSAGFYFWKCCLTLMHGSRIKKPEPLNNMHRGTE